MQPLQQLHATAMPKLLPAVECTLGSSQQARWPTVDHAPAVITVMHFVRFALLQCGIGTVHVDVRLLFQDKMFFSTALKKLKMFRGKRLKPNQRQGCCWCSGPGGGRGTAGRGIFESLNRASSHAVNRRVCLLVAPGSAALAVQRAASSILPTAPCHSSCVMAHGPLGVRV